MVLMERVSMVLLHTNPLVEGVVERREDQPEDLREDQPEENKHVSLLKFKFENRIHYSKQILNKKDVSLEERRPYSSLWC